MICRNYESYVGFDNVDSSSWSSDVRSQILFRAPSPPLLLGFPDKPLRWLENDRSQEKKTLPSYRAKNYILFLEYKTT